MRNSGQGARFVPAAPEPCPLHLDLPLAAGVRRPPMAMSLATNVVSIDEVESDGVGSKLQAE